MPARPRLVADKAIPWLTELFGRDYDLVPLAAGQIGRRDLVGADMLLVRAVTRVDESLLGGSKVRFVATTASGTDHLDKDFLDRAGVAWADGAGGNARAVVEYALAVIGRFLEATGSCLADRSLGLIGAGRIGSQLRQLAGDLGAQVLARDPWQSGADASLAQVLGCDMVSLHTALVADGPQPSLHMIGAGEIAALADTGLLLNTSRGEVLAEGFVAAAGRELPGMKLALDVWPDEPRPEPASVRACWFGSAHLAGHSLEGRLGCVLAAARAGAEFWQLPPPPAPALPELPPLKLDIAALEREIEATALPVSLLQQVVGLQQLHLDMQEQVGEAKDAAAAGRAFAALRSRAVKRREFAAYPLQVPDLSARARRCLDRLGFCLC